MDTSVVPAPATFGSRRALSREVEGFAVSDVHFGADLDLPRHTHDHAIVAVVMAGSMGQFGGSGRSTECRAATVLVEPAGEPHANRFGAAGARILMVSPEQGEREILEPFLLVLASGAHLHDPEISALAARVSHELSVPDNITPLAVTGLVLEMLARTSRMSARPKPVVTIDVSPEAAPDEPPATLDALAALDATALRSLYEAASTPTVADLDGDLVGRMLAFEGLRRGWLARALRAFAAWRHFPWRGKSFTTLDRDTGAGINRVFGDGRPRRWFRFATCIGASRAGAFSAFQLDYDHPGNPFYIRAIKDEVRQLRPGLFLGQAYLVTRRRTRLVLYFGLARV